MRVVRANPISDSAFRSEQMGFRKNKLGESLLITLAIALLVGSGCKRQAANEQSFFPASDRVAGWVKSGDTRTFAAADLWKYIDGEAERYLKAAVQSVATADYRFQDHIDAVADVYTMGSAQGAMQILQSEPALDGKPVQIGDEARLHSQSLVFRQGPYLVRIVAYQESAETQNALVQLGRGIDARLARR
jgi:hypothetical protein